MKLSPHCYAVLGLGCYPPWVVNAGFIAGSTHTLVVDSSASRLSAHTIYGYAVSANPGGKMLLINTEKHLDHLGGNCLFADNGVEIYGHALTRREDADLAGDRDFYNSCIQERVRKEAHEERVFYANTRIVNPSHTVRNNETFDLGGVEATIIFTPGHTDTNISVFVPSEKILYTGDAVVQGYIPNLESSTREGWKQWLVSLDTIASLGIDVLVPGHGTVLYDDDIHTAVDRMRTILIGAIDTGRAPTTDEQ